MQPTWNHGDFPDEDQWLDLEPEAVSPDFVDRTLARVLDDQEEIAAEAARVEDIQIPAELLAAYPAPEPSADFIERVGGAVARQRIEDRADARRILDAYAAPEPSPDFVARTMAALRLRRLPRPRSLLRGPWAWRTAAAAAAVLLAALLLWPDDGRRTLTQANASFWPPTAARTYSPSPVAAVMTGILAAEDPDALDGDFGDFGGSDGLALVVRVQGKRGP